MPRGSRERPIRISAVLLSTFAAELHKSVDFIVIGGALSISTNSSQLRDETIAESVHFVASAYDEVLAVYYTQAHLLVYPSLYEDFGFPRWKQCFWAARISCRGILSSRDMRTGGIVLRSWFPRFICLRRLSTVALTKIGIAKLRTWEKVTPRHIHGIDAPKVARCL